jgi:hypothetical protein
MNESETRAELIDPALHAAGWGGVEGSRNRLGIDLDMGFGGLATAQTNTAQNPQNARAIFERQPRRPCRRYPTATKNLRAKTRGAG